MSKRLRGADLVARTLAGRGASTPTNKSSLGTPATRLFALSGNHVMSIFDAVQDTGLEIVHTRHEASAVHMADAWGRLRGEPGIALATGGPGHANATAACFDALCDDAPLVLLSGHAGLKELGRGAFQEMAQAELSRPVTKASWTAASAQTLGHELARAIRTAVSGRPGPVHLSLPSDLLDQEIADHPSLWPDAADYRAVPLPLADDAAEAVVSALASARRPLILCGPSLATPNGRPRLAELQQRLGVPVIAAASPRGINDPLLGAFAEVMAQADLIVLIAKPLDFTLRFGDAPFVSEGCRFIAIHPEHEQLARIARSKGERLVAFAKADGASAVAGLLAHARPAPSSTWMDEVQSAVCYRPPEWQQAKATGAAAGQALHPVEACRELSAFLGRHSAHTLVIDGGEFGQWAQSLVLSPQRIINGIAGSIGSGLPFAIAAKAANPDHAVLVVSGDGSLGFHLAEFETALRHRLPLICVVGNDARWNAEYQIQLRTYGQERAKGCDLLPARYDKVVEALGGYGEQVMQPAELAAALERALASGKPALINVSLQGQGAPVVRRSSAVPAR